MKSRSLIITLVCALLIMTFPIIAGAAQTNVNVVVQNSERADQLSIGPKVNWADGVIVAKGTSAPGQPMALSRRAATIDAQRNLLEIINGVEIDSETTMKNLTIASDVVTSRVHAVIKGARIIKEQVNPDGSYEVTMAVNLLGPNSVTEVVNNAMISPQPTPFPVPSQNYRPVPNMPIYTGLVIDARSLGLIGPLPGPRIFDESGTVMYGYGMPIDRQISTGLVDYAYDADSWSLLTDGAYQRVGNHPLVIKAIVLRDDNKNVIISKADADRILDANKTGGFLQKAAVVFECDGLNL